MSAVNEHVQFRLIKMPCCHQMLCWVNPRLPNHCPECGTYILPQVRANVLITDTNAHIRYHPDIIRPMPKLGEAG